MTRYEWSKPIGLLRTEHYGEKGRELATVLIAGGRGVPDEVLKFLAEAANEKLDRQEAKMMESACRSSLSREIPEMW